MFCCVIHQLVDRLLNLTALYEFATKVTGSTPNVYYWINGEWFSGNYFIRNPLQNALFAPAYPSTGSGDCLAISNSGGSFVTIRQVCYQPKIQAICEYNTPAVKYVKTNYMPAPSICYHHGDLWSPSGVFLKSACIIDSPMTVPQGTSACQSNGMQLFAITSNEEMNALYAYAPPTKTQYYINGKFHIAIDISIIKSLFFNIRHEN